MLVKKGHFEVQFLPWPLLTDNFKKTGINDDSDRENYGTVTYQQQATTRSVSLALNAKNYLTPMNVIFS